MVETDKFSYIRDLGTHKVAVMRCPNFRYDFRGALTNEFILDEKSLRARITNYRKDGLPVDQSEAALVMLLKGKTRKEEK